MKLPTSLVTSTETRRASIKKGKEVHLIHPITVKGIIMVEAHHEGRAAADPAPGPEAAAVADSIRASSSKTPSCTRMSRVGTRLVVLAVRRPQIATTTTTTMLAMILRNVLIRHNSRRHLRTLPPLAVRPSLTRPTRSPVCRSLAWCPVRVVRHPPSLVS